MTGQQRGFGHDRVFPFDSEARSISTDLHKDLRPNYLSRFSYLQYLLKIDMENLQVGKLLGRGSYGAVYLAHDLVRQKRCVLKRVRFSEVNKEEARKIQLEINILQSFDHPNIVKCHEWFKDSDNGMLCLVMEYCSKGDLYECITRQNGVLFQEKEILVWFHQMLLGLEHMHKNRTIHRDIKTKNIFLTKYNIVKIGDFGCSRVLGTMELAQSFVGTPCYMAPELGTGKPYDYKTDVWALGCVLYELTCLKPPFAAENLYKLSKMIRKGEYEPIPAVFSTDLRELIARMMNIEPDERPTLAQILEMNFVNKTLADIYTNLIIQTQKQLGVHDSVDFSASIAAIKVEERPIDLLGSVSVIIKDATNKKIQELDKKLDEEHGKLGNIMRKEEFRKSVVHKSFRKLMAVEKFLPPAPKANEIAYGEDGILVPLGHNTSPPIAHDDSKTPERDTSLKAQKQKTSFTYSSPESVDITIPSPNPPDTPPFSRSNRPKIAETVKTTAVPDMGHEDEVLTGSVETLIPMKAGKKVSSSKHRNPDHPHLDTDHLDDEIDESFYKIDSLQIEKEDMLCVQKLMNNCWLRLNSHEKLTRDTATPIHRAAPSPSKENARPRHQRHSSDPTTASPRKKSPAGHNRAAGPPSSPSKDARGVSLESRLAGQNGNPQTVRQQHQNSIQITSYINPQFQTAPPENASSPKTRRGHLEELHGNEYRPTLSYVPSPHRSTSSRGSSAGSMGNTRSKPPLPYATASPMVSSGGSSTRSDGRESTPVQQTRAITSDRTPFDPPKLPQIDARYTSSRSKSAPSKGDDENPIKGRKEKYGDLSSPVLPKSNASDKPSPLNIQAHYNSGSPSKLRYSPKVKN